MVIKLINYWKKFISPLYSWTNCCKYNPSCSQYAIDSIFKYGTLKGSLKAFWRICRCNPICKGGDDPS